MGKELLKGMNSRVRSICAGLNAVPLQEECHYRNDRLAAVGAILGQVAFTDKHDQASMGCCKDPRASESAEN